MQRGFTLVELLVVLVIVGIAGGGIALALDRAQADDSEREVERLRRALEGAAYRAALRGRALAVEFLPDGYRVSERQPEGGWRRLEAPPELAPRAFGDGLRVTALHVAERTGRRALRTESDGIPSTHGIAFPAQEPLSPAARESGNSRRIVFETRPPAFVLELVRQDVRYRIAGRIDGRVQRLPDAENTR